MTSGSDLWEVLGVQASDTRLVSLRSGNPHVREQAVSRRRCATVPTFLKRRSPMTRSPRKALRGLSQGRSWSR